MGKKVRACAVVGGVSLVFMLFSGVFYLTAAVIEDEESAPTTSQPAKKEQPEKVIKQQEKPQEEKPAAVEKEEPVKSKSKRGIEFPFSIYEDKGPGNHYSPTGWMGDYGDIKVNADWKTNPHAGKTCIKITYSAKGAQGAGWAGIYWQYPANNWGNVDSGYNLTGAKKITFWARGEKGDEVLAEFKIGGIQGEYSDSDVAGIGPVKLTTEWKQYTIDLEGKDLSRIAGGFCWAASGDENPDGFVIYLDDIVYEK